MRNRGDVLFLSNELLFSENLERERERGAYVNYIEKKKIAFYLFVCDNGLHQL